MAIDHSEVKEFGLPDSLDELSASLSHDRLATYTNATSGNRVDAMRLYAWNTAVSAAFYGPLQALEVALRNSMTSQLALAYGASWYENPAAGLDHGCRQRIRESRRKLARERYPDDSPHIVASLSFGFWVSLLGRGGLLDQRSGVKANYEMTLWRPALRGAFPHADKVSRKRVHKPLYNLRILRNRIAHHEPVFMRDLRDDYQSILTIADWIAPRKSRWIAAHSRLPEVLATPRDSSQIKF
ncbi:Abi family protein [Stappia indica]|uniref:Abi family protein n=1 Tax=Stappia indica TaxID=538381 RepID=UPI001CD514C4|nr:Abi family protein [Stappia indica]MCA1297167.1 Abi family protein [Stappia indica]